MQPDGLPASPSAPCFGGSDHQDVHEGYLHSACDNYRLQPAQELALQEAQELLAVTLLLDPALLLLMATNVERRRRAPGGAQPGHIAGSSVWLKLRSNSNLQPHWSQMYA